jgi:hypothetical protein
VHNTRPITRGSRMPHDYDRLQVAISGGVDRLAAAVDIGWVWLVALGVSGSWSRVGRGVGHPTGSERAMTNTTRVGSGAWRSRWEALGAAVVVTLVVGGNYRLIQMSANQRQLS